MNPRSARDDGIAIGMERAAKICDEEAEVYRKLDIAFREFIKSAKNMNPETVPMSRNGRGELVCLRLAEQIRGNNK